MRKLAMIAVMQAWRKSEASGAFVKIRTDPVAITKAFVIVSD
jgi:hypothetical protein